MLIIVDLAFVIAIFMCYPLRYKSYDGRIKYYRFDKKMNPSKKINWKFLTY